MLNEIEIFVRDFFEKLLIDVSALEVIEEDENIFFIKIETTDSGILIGNHGSTFESTQSILRNVLSHRFDKKIKIHLEVNDYIHSRDAKLFSFIDKKISLAKELNKDIKLPVFNGYERKKIHSYVSDLNDDLINTESRGEGKDRRLFLVVDKKINISKIEHSKLDIDIDGDDI